MRPVVFGTAGHIDHGKTTLVRRLTGRDTDRLPEEKARGISIDLGFAPLVLPSGRSAAFVDVPGHERFVRNMVAGVHGMDAVLLVVAADEGVMPQTREHLAILRLLGVEHGLTVLTKVDLVEADWLDLVRADTAEALAGSFLADAPILPVSAVTGEGIPELLAELDRLADSVPPRDTTGLLRLPVDRVFTVRGFGTVVTGTMTSGQLAVDEVVTVLPEDLRTRVRGLEVHGQRVERAMAGQRVAVNLGGVERSLVRRGQVLARPGTFSPVTVATLLLTLLEDASPLKHRGRVHTHTGTQEALARVYFFDREELAPGDRAWAELRWEEPVVVQRGDRVLIRSYSPVTTIGGGQVVELGIHHTRRERGLLERLEAALASDPVTLAVSRALEAGMPVPLAELARHVGLEEETLRQRLAEVEAVELAEDRTVLHRDVRARLEAAVREQLADYHRRYPLRPGLPREAFRPLFAGWDPRAMARFLLSVPGVVADREWLRLASFTVALDPTDEARARRLVETLTAQGLRPEDIEAVLAGMGADDERGRDLVQWLVHTGRLVKVDEGLYLTREVFEQAAAAVRQALAERGALNTSALREVLGTSRKYAVPILERMDEARITRRVGDTRVLGGA
ncbi:MAG: selenocysteine-specific translation elongation factor [Actinomycetia bacterium]|nr:selenocysteine-specific translation elongation factor [Actinomycetes bacterium]